MGKHSRKNHQPLFKRITTPMTTEEELTLLTASYTKATYVAEINCGKCDEVHTGEDSVQFIMASNPDTSVQVRGGNAYTSAQSNDEAMSPIQAAAQWQSLKFDQGGMSAKDIRTIIRKRNQPGKVGDPLAKGSMRITILSIGPGTPIPAEAKFEERPARRRGGRAS